MEELLKKEEGLTSWRYKLNKILGRISSLLQGSNEKAVLTSVNGKISWEPVVEDEAIEEIEKIDSLKIDGVLSTSSLSVTGTAAFNCNASISGGISARSLSLSDMIVLKGNGRTESIYASEKGLILGSITIGDKAAELPSMIMLGGNAVIGATPSSVSIYGRACPMKLDTERGLAEFPYGLRTDKVSFSEGEMNGKTYSGCASSAVKFSSPVKIFGLDFDGSKPLSGQIKDCTGIILSKGSKIMFMHGIGQMQAGWFECIGDVLSWNGRMKPKSFNVETEHYAEWYPCSETMENGDVVSLDFDSDEEMYAKVTSERKRPLGVVTTDYAMCVGTQTDNSYPVCTKGRVKAKVEGNVKKGDSLVAGSSNGVLRAMNSKDKVYEAWAIALESSDKESIKLVKVHIL